MDNYDIAWCPGCGNFSILKELNEVIEELKIDSTKLVLVSGIGQAAKIPQYMNVNFFNGLHGRSLPVATAIKASNPELTVIAESGDGDMYGEGGNHFIHTIRRNTDIVNIVHNNMIYGLTKGQASPTTQKGMKTSLQIFGVNNEPFNPIAVAISLGASFVARVFSGDREETKAIIKKAVQHKGYALVDIFQPCVTFNKINNYKWFKENTYYLDDQYNPLDKTEAFKKSMQTDKLPLGIIYMNKNKTFEELLPAYQEDSTPVYKRKRSMDKIKEMIDLRK